ncbi:M23 family metallopeptidase [Luteimonas deserti]|uniref:M23 family metallopeptidase n=1 Tax=Luteimonas deserti TaxID=2752306 RepID=A0A7Z0TVA9_9GAMM|nr:M23 family metallopeptidase [Luteimonas deserti]NYZ63681.1 M23 family metallopeptidase [Luteimonas deserti]
MDAPTPTRRDYTPQLRRTLRLVLTLAVLAAAAYWSWHQPFMAKPRAIAALTAAPAPESLPVPVEGVRASSIADTYGAPRGADRRHEGVDIFAPRGTPVTSTTDGLVVGVRDAGLGGRQVWIMGPGRQRHYYAHLDAWADLLSVGDIVRAGEAIGTVGNTGNARGTPPHLHYGIYAADGAFDPLPLLRAGADSGDAAR